jgi:hypothetical protein
MDGVMRPDLGNILMIGLIAFALIWLLDRGLRRVGLGAWTTSGA